MATWKKLVVSGSDISQLNNDAGYLTSVTAQNAFVTASINGVALIADSSQGTLTFVSGAGMFITGDSGTDTLTFSVNSGSMLPYYSSSIFSTVSGDITISSAGVATIGANSVALGTDTTGNYVATITAGSGINTTGASTGETIAHTISVNSGSMLPYYSSSIFGTVSGDILISSAGVATIQANSVALGTDTTGNYVADVDAGLGISVTGTAGEGTTFVVNLNTGSTHFTNGVVSALPTGTVSSSVQIDGTAITNNSLTIGDSTIALGGTDTTLTGLTDIDLTAGSKTIFDGIGANTLTIGAGTTTVNFANNVIVTGDLTVNGTTTTLNTTNLLVEDQFILLSSGSAGDGDGGIIVDRGAFGSGNIGFGYDSGTNRWGFQDGLADTTNTIDPTSANGVSGSFVPYLFTEASHGATRPSTGEFVKQGSIYVGADEAIYIYS